MQRSWQHRAVASTLVLIRFCLGRMRRICLRSSKYGKSLSSALANPDASGLSFRFARCHLPSFRGLDRRFDRDDLDSALSETVADGNNARGLIRITRPC